MVDTKRGRRVNKRRGSKSQKPDRPNVEPAHYPLSPSSAHRWLNCPDSVNAPKTPSNAKAEAGTLAHAEIEGVLEARAFGPIDTFLMEDRVYAGSMKLLQDRKIANEIADASTTYVEYVAARAAGEVYLETKIKHATIPNFGGTIDCLEVRPRSLQITDFKSGVWPAHLEQLMCYALLARQEFPRGSVAATIVQPRAKDGRKVRTEKWSRSDLDRFEDKVAAVPGNTERRAGDWCRFCGFRPTCAVANEAGAPR